MFRRKPSSPESLRKRREKERRREERERAQVTKQLRKAGIAERRDRTDGGLLSQPVLAFRGPQGELRVFDRNADLVGAAVKSTSGSELLDTDGNLVLAVERPVGAFLVRGRSGSVICRIAQDAVGVKFRHSVRPVTSPAGEPLGFLQVRSSRVAFEDAAGNEIVKITVQNTYSGEFVAEVASSAAEPLRTIGIAVTIVWDLKTSRLGGP